MSIVQWFKSQVHINGDKYPIPEGGANLSWDRNIQAPAIAGNYVQQNWANGMQMPQMDTQIVLLDGSTNYNPIVASKLNTYFMNRTADYQHDVGQLTGAFFDGYSGWSGLFMKGGAFSLSIAKGQLISYSQSFACYVPEGQPEPASITAPTSAYDPFAGTPINFESVCWFRNGVPWDGVVSMNLTYSNNLSPDPSFTSDCPQSVFPIDCNAGMPTGTCQFTFQADAVQHIADGDELAFQIQQGVINTTFTLKNVIPGNPYTRSVGSGRQMRTYNLVLLGTGNNANQNLLVIS